MSIILQSHQYNYRGDTYQAAGRIHWIKIGFRFIAAALALVWFTAAPVEAWHSEVGFDSHSTWMKDLGTEGHSSYVGLEQRPLSQVIIPLAHDALMGSAEQPDPPYPGDAYVTQDLSVPDLLDYGVRAFDMRFCPKQDQDGSDSNWYGCHGTPLLTGPLYTISNQTHEDIIQQISDFTFDPNHEKEILLIRWTKTMCDPGPPNTGGCYWNPSQGMVDKLCADFFEEFRDIIIEKPTAGADITLEEIWHMPGHPRIILNSGECGHYFDTEFLGAGYPSYAQRQKDKEKIWQFHEGRNKSTEDVAIIKKNIADDLINDPPQNIESKLTSIQTNGHSIFGLMKLSKNTWLNKKDLFGNQIPDTGIRDYLIYINDEEYTARSRLNIIWGDFLEHIKLVEWALDFNRGPIAIVEAEQIADGDVYLPAKDVWAGPVLITLDCDTTDGTKDKSTDQLKWPATDIDVELFEPAGGHLIGSFPKKVAITKTVWNEKLIAECWDASGKLARKTFGPLNIDADPPFVEGRVVTAISGTDNTGAAWYKKNVSYYWNCYDMHSGLAESAEDLCGWPNSLAEITGEGRNLSGSPVLVSDQVGNETEVVLKVNIDKTSPIITSTRTPANSNGWNNDDVTVNFTCTDNLSGIATDVQDLTLSNEGANQSADSGPCVDKANNTASESVDGINIDKTPPAVAMTGVADGSTYILGSVPEAGCITSDVLSGISSEASVSISGGTSNNVGIYTVTCSGARDKADNLTASVSASYTVEYDFAGFFSPANREINKATAGDTIPIKFSLAGDFGIDVLISTTSAQVECTTGDVMEAAIPTRGVGLHPLKHADRRYQYQWKTEESWNNTCRVFTLTLDDGSMHTSLIDFNGET